MRTVELAANLYRWLMSNNIPVKDFRLILSFPNQIDKSKAEFVILRELQELFRFQEELTGEMKSFNLHGIDFRLESRIDK